jgi:DNA helicase HerA-like ATPase
VTNAIPSAALTQHVAILGMTGSGKTNTSKVAIEQVYAEGARVCVLDPIKSDWWGLTSSADGAGRAAVPHPRRPARARAAALRRRRGDRRARRLGRSCRISIIDMADFGMGGICEAFFNDFAPALLKRIGAGVAAPGARGGPRIRAQGTLRHGCPPAASRSQRRRWPRPRASKWADPPGAGTWHTFEASSS